MMPIFSPWQTTWVHNELIAGIRRAVYLYGPLTHYEIASYVDAAYPGRWSEATIRTACARAGLIQSASWGTTPRGRRCHMWRLDAYAPTVNVSERFL